MNLDRHRHRDRKGKILKSFKMRSNSLGHTEVYKGFDCQVAKGGDN